MDARPDQEEMEEAINKLLQLLKKQENQGFKDLATLLSQLLLYQHAQYHRLLTRNILGYPSSWFIKTWYPKPWSSGGQWTNWRMSLPFWSGQTLTRPTLIQIFTEGWNSLTRPISEGDGQTLSWKAFYKTTQWGIGMAAPWRPSSVWNRSQSCTWVFWVHHAIHGKCQSTIFTNLKINPQAIWFYTWLSTYIAGYPGIYLFDHTAPGLLPYSCALPLLPGGSPKIAPVCVAQIIWWHQGPSCVFQHLWEAQIAGHWGSPPLWSCTSAPVII